MGISAAVAGHVPDLHRKIRQAVADELRAMASGGGSIWVASLTAFALGTVHALAPSHGKVALLAHFLGRRAQPWAGMAAAQIAGLHVGSATFLVLAVGAASSAFGRPIGVAPRANGQDEGPRRSPAMSMRRIFAANQVIQPTFFNAILSSSSKKLSNRRP